MTSTSSPTVSFVVPCYKLGHLLAECIDSILAQSYQSFEILIMDDCSPDNTAEVVRSYTDSRVQYILNPVNLGHLRNYNEGITRARGKYVWLISADDRLRSDRVLERYVAVMEKEPGVGFIFCPAVGLDQEGETGVLPYSVRADQDTVFNGHDFLTRFLLDSDCVVVASAMARRECYAKVSMYPLDMPYAGDWYIWSIFALHYDVAYLATPMVCYREHNLSMTNRLKQRDARILVDDDLKVLWRIRAAARAVGYSTLVRACAAAIVGRYVLCINHEVHGLAEYRMTMEECAESVRRHACNEGEFGGFDGRIKARLADEHYWSGRYAEALQLYALALRAYFWMPSIWVKVMLLKAGKMGITVRSLHLLPRRMITRRPVRP